MTDRRLLAFQELDFEVEFSMRRKIVSFLLGEDVSELVVLGRYTGSVRS